MYTQIEGQNDQLLTPHDIEILADLMAEEPDHYTVLGVDRNDPINLIQDAYKLAVTSFHPSLLGHITESNRVMHWKLSQVIKRINEAYSTLSNSRRRKLYDDIRRFRLEDYEDYDVTSKPKEISDSYIESRCRYIQSRHKPAELDASFNSANPSQARGNEKVVAIDERRRVERIPLQLPVLISCDAFNWQVFAESRDVSPLGIRLLVSRHIEPGTLVKIETPMPRELRLHSNNEKLYTVDAMVIHSVEKRANNWVSAEFIF
ncbi:MAG TPA: DnaJ domain-containing protein [Blastocatellia bacterium]|nr:DnaJ domain-containing protein [Blastocatellia bacterium]